MLITAFNRSLRTHRVFTRVCSPQQTEAVTAWQSWRSIRRPTCYYKHWIVDNHIIVRQQPRKPTTFYMFQSSEDITNLRTCSWKPSQKPLPNMGFPSSFLLRRIDRDLKPYIVLCWGGILGLERASGSQSEEPVISESLTHRGPLAVFKRNENKRDLHAFCALLRSWTTSSTHTPTHTVDHKVL